MAKVTIKPLPKDRLQPIYGFDDVTTKGEVSILIDEIRKNLGKDMNNVLIYVLSGTHGDTNGNLVGEKTFFLEDKSKEIQTVKAVNVNQDTPPNTWKKYFDSKKAIIILAWCYSNNWNGLTTYNK
ncbi:hypothetical protein [Fluviicola taffensis]|uniref:hypothetical protein n=1 Tax=Fluviicola taffensis TaxID=191579 RepID=UPI00313812B1